MENYNKILSDNTGPDVDYSFLDEDLKRTPSPEEAKRKAELANLARSQIEFEKDGPTSLSKEDVERLLHMPDGEAIVRRSLAADASAASLRRIQERLYKDAQSLETSQDAVQAAESLAIIGSNFGYKPETVLEEKASAAIADAVAVDPSRGESKKTFDSDERIRSLSMAYFALQQVAEEQGQEFANQGLLGKAKDVGGLLLPGVVQKRLGKRFNLTGGKINETIGELISEMVLKHPSDIEGMKQLIRDKADSGLFGNNSLLNWIDLQDASSGGLNRNEKAFETVAAFADVADAVGVALVAGKLATKGGKAAAKATQAVTDIPEDEITTNKLGQLIQRSVKTQGKIEVKPADAMVAVGAHDTAAEMIAKEVMASEELASLEHVSDLAKVAAGLDDGDFTIAAKVNAKLPPTTESLAADDLIRLKKNEELFRLLLDTPTGARLSPEQVRIAAAETASKIIKADNLIDADQIPHIVYTKTEPNQANGLDVFRTEVLLGKTGREAGWGDAESAAAAADNWGFTPGSYSVKEHNGQHYLSITRDVEESFRSVVNGGYFNWSNGRLSRVFSSVLEPIKRTVFGADTYVSETQKFMAHMNAVTINNAEMFLDKVTNSFKFHNKKDVEATSALALRSLDRRGWMSELESRRFLKENGMEYNENVAFNYALLKQMHKFDGFLLNDLVYTDLVRNGYRQMTINGQSFPAKIVEPSDVDLSKAFIWNVENQELYEPGSQRYLDFVRDAGAFVGETDAARAVPKDYVLVRPASYRKAVKMAFVDNPDKPPFHMDLALVPRSEIETDTLLSYQQLNTKLGGHHEYDAVGFMKQARTYTKEDGTVMYVQPRAYFGFKTLIDGKKWVDKFEQARMIFINGKMSRKAKANAIGKLLAGTDYEDIAMWEKLADSGTWDMKQPFELVGDREKPSVYKNLSNDQIIGLDVDLENQSKISRSAFIHEKDEEELKHPLEKFVSTINPFSTAAAGLENAVKARAYSSYRIRVANEFVATYGKVLDQEVMDAFSKGRVSPEDIISNPVYRKDLTLPEEKFLVEKAKGQSKAYNAFLNAPTVEKRATDAMYDAAIDYVFKNTDNEEMEKFFRKQKDYDLLTAATSLVYDTTFALDPSQYLVQLSTAAISNILEPTYGVKATPLAVPLLSAVQHRNSKAHIARLAKVSAKMGLVKNEKQFHEMFKLMDRTGFTRIDNTLAVIDRTGVSKFVADQLGKNVQTVRKGARSIIMQAEKTNRAVAFSIQYMKALDEGLDLTQPDVLAKFISQADALSVNMTRASAAAWQRGTLKIPTQFLSFNVRMLELYFGSDFTPMQKLRLAAMQSALWGAAGSITVPFVGNVSNSLSSFSGDLIEMIGEQTGGDTKEIADNVSRIIQEGVVDGLFWDMMGFDVTTASRFGNDLLNGRFIEEIMNGNILEVFGGPLKGKVETEFDAIRNLVLVTRSVLQEGEVRPEDIYDILSVVTDPFTIMDRAERAWIIMETGDWIANNGSVLRKYREGDEKWKVALTALFGFQHDQISDAHRINDWLKKEGLATSLEAPEMLKGLAGLYTEAMYWALHSPDQDVAQHMYRRAQVIRSVVTPGTAAAKAISRFTANADKYSDWSRSKELELLLRKYAQPEVDRKARHLERTIGSEERNQ